MTEQMVRADGQVRRHPEQGEDPRPAGRPVGHEGTRVDVQERRAWQGNGLWRSGWSRCSRPSGRGPY
jgi:hypothetical protein